MKQLLILTLLLLLQNLLFGQQPGLLDFSFDADGLVMTSPGTVEDRAFAVTMQTDGKIVVAGVSALSGDRRSFVSCYLPDGSLDMAFGTNGHQILNLQTGVDDYFNSIFIQPDGKIVASGPSGSANPFMTNISRLLSNGAPDPGFGTNGSITVNIPGGSCYPYALLPDASGRILVAGSDNAGMILLRILPDGTPDSTFSNDGIAIHAIPGILTQADGMALDTAGRIIIVGYASNPFSYLVARFDTNGVLDATFGQGGLSMIPMTGFGGLNDCKVQADGKIVACGSFDASGGGSNHDFIVLRMNDDGSLDAGFANAGKMELPVSSQRDILQSILIQPDNKLLVAGYAQQGASNGNFALLRLLPDGAFDTTFGSNGLVLTDFNSNVDISSQLVLQPDLKAVVCGWTYQNNKWNVALARYHTGLNVGLSEFAGEITKTTCYPNPVQDFLTIIDKSWTSNPKMVHIFNCYGTDLGSFYEDALPSGSNQITLDVNRLIPGVYFLRATGSSNTVCRFVKL